MRKILCITIAIALLFLLQGCRNSPSDTVDTVVFYYIHNDFEYGTASGVITPTIADVKNISPDYTSILEKYFNGLTNDDCISPFPDGITLEDFQVDNNKAQIVLSPHMATISGSSLTIALACLTRTVIELTDVKTVQISIQNNQINGMDSLTLSLNSFAYMDDIKP